MDLQFPMFALVTRVPKLWWSLQNQRGSNRGKAPRA